MLFLAAVVFGVLSYGRLPVTLMPDLSYPTLTVRTEYPGAAPEEVENDVSRPIEEQVGVVAGLRKLSSVSRAGISDVMLEFAWDTEMSEATQDVLEKLDLVFLPEEANRPLILHYDPALDPVLELSLSGQGERYSGASGLRRLRRLAELRIKKELEPVKGVAAVRVRGGLEEEIHVRLEAEALRRSGISIQQVIDRLGQENINVAGGTLKEGRTEYLVRTLNEFQDLEQIESTIVASFDGRNVRVMDLGRVEMAHKEREIVTRTDGAESVQIEIFKEGDANIVALAQRVKSALGTFDPEAPDEAAAGSAGGQRGGDQRAKGLAAAIWREEGAQLKLVADRSLFIESSIREVRDTAILGGLLAIVVLYLFLRNFKSTAIIAISIPMSLAITFAPLHLLGVSLNIMSLGGLALGIGMLVDSSIVVLESIFRCVEEGDDLLAGAVRGTGEVRGAVFASTMTSIAVFFPMVFVEGIAGQAFGDLGLAVVVSLLASAGVALWFIPMLASRRTSFSIDGIWFEYFASEGWVRLRTSWAAWSTWRRFLLGPSFVLQFVFSFHDFYLRRAWVELKACLTWPIWFAIPAFPLWLVAALLLVPLPYVARAWVALLDAHCESYRFAWRQFVEDFRGLPWWLIALTVWFWIPRAALALVLPELFVTRSWQVVREDYCGKPTWARLLIVLTVVVGVFLLLRWLFGSLLEALARLIALLGTGFVVLFLRILLPVLVVVPSVLTRGLVRSANVGLGALQRAYPRVLRTALAHPTVIMLVVLACFVVTWQVGRGLESELLPEVHQGEFTVEVRLPVGTPLERTETIIAPIERAILEERDSIESMILTVGFDSVTSQRSDEGEHTARFKVLLDEKHRGAEAEQLVIERLRARFAAVPDMQARVVRPVLFSAKTPIEVEVHGHDLQQLKRYADQVQQQMAALPELADVETTLKSGAPEVQIVYDRERLARYGMNILEVARRVRDNVQGFEATRFNMLDRRIPIVVRLDIADRETVNDVRALIVNPGDDRPIRLSSVADVTLGEGPSEVRRIDGSRVAVVSANIAEGSLSGASDAIRASLARYIDWPAEMTFFISGQNEEWQASQRSLWIALGLSVFLVYVIMAAQFESLLQPLVIMLTIPLAFVGTMITLELLGLALSIVVFLGMIMLAGIVVNNAIVLVDYINTLRSRGQGREEAIVNAGTVRLRPILMTTTTTVLGLLPMALGLGDGAEIRTPMAIAVISGLISSTALTLVVIPSVYDIVERAKAHLLGQAQPTRQADDASLSSSGSRPVTP